MFSLHFDYYDIISLVLYLVIFDVKVWNRCFEEKHRRDDVEKIALKLYLLLPFHAQWLSIIINGWKPHMRMLWIFVFVFVNKWTWNPKKFIKKRIIRSKSIYMHTIKHMVIIIYFVFGCFEWETHLKHDTISSVSLCLYVYGSVNSVVFVYSILSGNTAGSGLWWIHTQFNWNIVFYFLFLFIVGQQPTTYTVHFYLLTDRQYEIIIIAQINIIVNGTHSNLLKKPQKNK